MKRWKKYSLTVGVSLVIGLINGFFGGGGGMLVVPLLERGLNVPTKNAHATAIAVILPISIAGAITYLIGGYFSLAPVLSVSAGCVAGGLIGALLLKKLPASVTAVVFSLVMIGAGVKLAIG